MEFINEFINYCFEYINLDDKSNCDIIEDDIQYIYRYYINSKDCMLSSQDSDLVVKFNTKKPFFEKYNEEFNPIVSNQSICCNTQLRLMEIVNCKLTGIQKLINIESNILYLVFQSQNNPLSTQDNCENCSIINKPLEKEKIEYAVLLIRQNLDQNLSIQGLSQAVGTNQCYLKKGFKELTGLTIFEFIQENRMIKAKHLIQTENFTTTQISVMVGYSSLSSFSQSFKNYFGASPSQLSKFNIS